MSLQPKPPIPATVDALVRILAARPVLWVGAGASVAAGALSSAALIELLCTQADDEIPPGADLPRVVDAFIASNGQGALRNLLSDVIDGRPLQPTGVHRAIARLADAGRFAAIVTSNHDGLLEDALRRRGVAHVVQTLEDNATVRADTLRLLKIHGSHTDWVGVLLSGRSQRQFDRRYQFLVKQLDVLLQQHPVLFVGCSMTHPRLLDWLGGRKHKWADSLDRWRPMMTLDAWHRALAAPWHRGRARDPLARGNVRPLVVRDYRDHLLRLWRDAADRMAPEGDRSGAGADSTGTDTDADTTGRPLTRPRRATCELELRIRRRAGEVQVSYHLADHTLVASHTRPWSDVAHAQAVLEPLRRLPGDTVNNNLVGAIGSALFSLAFGPASHWRPVMRAVFAQMGHAPQPNPIYAPVRVRIYSADAEIRALPWRLMTWNGRLLVDSGWCVDTETTLEPRHDYTTSAPATTVVITTRTTQTDAIRELLNAVWTEHDAGEYVHPIPISTARDADPRAGGLAERIRHELRMFRPDIVYVYMPEAGAEHMTEAAQALVLQAVLSAGHRPQVMYLDAGHTRVLADAVARTSAAPAPLVIWRRSLRRSPNADLIPIYWLRRWLTRVHDPVVALHQVVREYFARDLEAATLVVHSAYHTWRTSRHRRPKLADAAASALHKLDRDEAKALIVRHMKELARSEMVRVMAVIAYAAPGNQLAALGEQLRLELEVEAYRDIALAWHTVAIPDERDELRTQLQAELALQLDAVGSESLQSLLDRHGPRAGGRAQRVLWLDCGVFGRGPGQAAPLTRKQLDEWTAFAGETLVAGCPPDLRVVWYLAVETEQHQAMAKAITALFERYSHAGFRIDELHLGRVTERHLLNYLREHGGCPANIERELSERILAATEGRFADTVDILEQGRQGSWHALCERLRREQGVTTSEVDEDFQF